MSLVQGEARRFPDSDKLRRFPAGTCSCTPGMGRPEFGRLDVVLVAEIKVPHLPGRSGCRSIPLEYSDIASGRPELTAVSAGGDSAAGAVAGARPGSGAFGGRGALSYNAARSNKFSVIDLEQEPAMGKGDKRTFRGKIYAGSYGNTRPQKGKKRPAAKTPPKPPLAR